MCRLPTYTDVRSQLPRRVDNVVLNGLSSIDTKLDTYGRTLNSDIHHVHRKIAFQLEQLEDRVQQKIDILSGAAAEVHRQNNLRITELYDVTTPNELLQTDHLSTTIQSGNSDMTFADSTSQTSQISLVDSLTEKQQEGIANQTKKKDIEALDSLLPGLQDAIRRWKVYANGTDSKKIALESSKSLLSNILKEIEETHKEYSLALGILENFRNKPTLLSFLGLYRTPTTIARIGRALEVG